MFADASVKAAEGADKIGPKILAFLDQAVASAKDGLTWVEFGQLLLAVIRIAVTTLDTVQQLSGPEKKELVLEAVAALFDRLADKAVPPVAYPLWLLAKPSIRSLILALSAGAVEIVLPMVRT